MRRCKILVGPTKILVVDVVSFGKSRAMRGSQTIEGRCVGLCRLAISSKVCKHEGLQGVEGIPLWKFDAEAVGRVAGR